MIKLSQDREQPDPSSETRTSLDEYTFLEILDKCEDKSLKIWVGDLLKRFLLSEEIRKRRE